LIWSSSVIWNPCGSAMAFQLRISRRAFFFKWARVRSHFSFGSSFMLTHTPLYVICWATRVPLSTSSRAAARRSRPPPRSYPMCSPSFPPPPVPQLHWRRLKCACFPGLQSKNECGPLRGKRSSSQVLANSSSPSHVTRVHGSPRIRIANPDFH
jgi:hypothetical protein